MRVGTVLVFALAATQSLSVYAQAPSAETMLRRAVDWSNGFQNMDANFDLVSRFGVRERKGTFRISTDQQIRTTEKALAQSPSVGVWLAVLRARTPEQLRESLIRRRLDLRTVALYHFNRRIVVIVGSTPRERGRAQIWLDRETGAPIRVVVRSSSGQAHDLILDHRPAPGVKKSAVSSFRWRDGTGWTVDGRLRDRRP
jgi:hypothetical protein